MPKDEVGKSRAMAIIDKAHATGDYAPVIGMAMRARMAAEEGRYCACSEPILAGFDLMCGACLLENREQIRRWEEAHAAPHAYVVGRHDDIGMCDFCTRWKDDPIHHEYRDALGG